MTQLFLALRIRNLEGGEHHFPPNYYLGEGVKLQCIDFLRGMTLSGIIL